MQADVVSSPKMYDNIRSYVERKLTRHLTTATSDGILLLPDFAVFLVRLMQDPRTPLSRRLAATAAIGYLVTPFDLSPDFLPFWGLVDDLFMVALTIRELIRSSDREALEQHWPNSNTDMLETVESALDWVRGRAPERLWKRWMAHRLF